MMIVKLTAAATFAAALLMASSASATLIRDYELNNSLTDSAGSGVNIVNNGALGATGITFGVNQGPTVNGLSLSTYTIATSFEFATLDGYRKIVDFKNLASDNGLYNLSTDLNYFDFSFGPNGSFTAGTDALVVLTRDGATKLVTGYVNGVQVVQFTDSTNDAVIGDPLRFFQDDNATGNREASSGFVDYIKIYDTALAGGNIGGGGVPEPASWALMILGLGSVGAAMRHRRHASLATA